jgi:hypothetical protein
MTQKSKKKLRKNNYGDFTWGKIITLATVVLFTGIIIGLSIDSKNESSRNNITAAQTIFASNTLNLSKEFACSCGTCGEINLASCTCDTAIGTKIFIEDNLKKGIPEWEVTELVKNIYGHYLGG